MKNRITLLPWPNPDWKENPYQKLLYKELTKHGIQILPTPITFSLIPFKRPFDWLHLNWPDTLYTHRSPKKQAERFSHYVKILSTLKRRGTKILWTMHNEYPHESDDLEFHKQALAKTAELCDLIHVHFSAAVELLKQEYHVDPQKIIVVPHGHYADYYGDPIPKEEARKAFNIPHHARVILSFGYLRKYKGIEDAIASFHETKNNQLYFLIAGEPADKKMTDYLQNDGKRNPKLLMHLSKIKEKDFVRYFSAADVFIFPSRNFFTSGSIMLALTYNLPVIAIPKNHTLQFLGKSFLKPWQPPDKNTLTYIMDNLEGWLATVNYEELEETKQELDFEKLARELNKYLQKNSESG